MHPLAVVLVPAHCACFRGIPLGIYDHVDASGFTLVVEHGGEFRECPAVETFVAVTAPVTSRAVFLRSDAAEITDPEAANVPYHTLSDDVFRECMQVVASSALECPLGPPRRVRGTIRPFTVVLDACEVVFVLFERPTGVQQGVVPERDSSKLTDPQVNASGPVARRIGNDILDITHNV